MIFFCKVKELKSEIVKHDYFDSKIIFLVHQSEALSRKTLLVRYDKRSVKIISFGHEVGGQKSLKIEYVICVQRVQPLIGISQKAPV